jgi:hypothetical protein
MTLGHLARRFFGSLWPAGPNATAQQFVAASLNTGELELWRRMSAADRRHSVAVARRVVAVAGDPPEVVAAALLHDVGKIDSALGTFARVAATIVGPRRARGRMAAYLRHDAIGADLLQAAGARDLVVTWAREHHLPPERWTVPSAVGAALKAADDD